MSGLYPDLYRTTFPESVDKFTQFLDIMASDGEMIGQYQDALSMGDEALANQILQQIPAYKQKIVTAKDLNKLLDAAVALERFYKTDIEPYVEEKQTQWQGIIDKFTYVEPFSPTSNYVKNNYVSYGLGSSKYLYIALNNPPQGTLPTDSTYWRQLTVQGKKGEPGSGLAFTGKWDGGTTYKANDTVEYSGGLWNALQPSTAQIPIEGSPYWRLVYKLGTTVYPVSVDRPLQQADNELWFRIVK